MTSSQFGSCGCANGGTRNLEKMYCLRSRVFECELAGGADGERRRGLMVMTACATVIWGFDAFYILCCRIFVSLEILRTSSACSA